MKKSFLFSLLVACLVGQDSIAITFNEAYEAGKSIAKQANASNHKVVNATTPTDVFGHTINTDPGFEKTVEADPLEAAGTIKTSMKKRLADPLKTTTKSQMDEALASFDAADEKGSAMVASALPACAEKPREAPSKDVEGSETAVSPYCDTPIETPSKDFDQSVSALSVIGAASQAKSGKTETVLFGGTAQHCREIAVGYSNCCAKKGWGQTLYLAHCNAAEKKLGRARQSGRAIFLGRYCKHRALSVCTEHAQVFCVFPSKMAKIIQAQGRVSQLKQSLGSAKKPDCRGLSVESFSALNLERIDFSALYADVENNATLPANSPIDVTSIDTDGADMAPDAIEKRKIEALEKKDAY